MPCLCRLGLNLPGRRIAREPDLGVSDVRAVTEAPRRGLAARLPPTILRGAVGIDEVHAVAGREGNPAAVAEGGARRAGGG